MKPRLTNSSYVTIKKTYDKPNLIQNKIIQTPTPPPIQEIPQSQPIKIDFDLKKHLNLSNLFNLVFFVILLVFGIYIVNIYIERKNEKITKAGDIMVEDVYKPLYNIIDESDPIPENLTKLNVDKKGSYIGSEYNLY